MAGDRSFTDYVKSRFLDDLYPAAEEYVEQNWEGLDLDLRSIHQVGGVAMTDMTIKFVSVSDLPDLKIEFDVVVDAEIEIIEGDYHYDEYDICNQWLSFRCTGDLATNLDDFKITSITPYQKGKMPRPLSDALVPYIYKEDLDKVAVDFLRKYYPEALKAPMPLDRKRQKLHTYQCPSKDETINLNKKQGDVQEWSITICAACGNSVWQTMKPAVKA